VSAAADSSLTETSETDRKTNGIDKWNKNSREETAAAWSCTMEAAVFDIKILRKALFIRPE